jgi:HSP20 family protein
MPVVRSDPFREVDRLMQNLMGQSSANGRALTMPMDAYRKADEFLLQLDLPGVNVDSIELTVEDNVLSVRAERRPPEGGDGIETVITERPYGDFTRQVFLGENLDTTQIKAEYEAGVLTLSIPVAPHAKPRRIPVTSRQESQTITA